MHTRSASVAASYHNSNHHHHLHHQQQSYMQQQQQLQQQYEGPGAENYSTNHYRGLTVSHPPDNFQQVRKAEEAHKNKV